MTTTSFSCFAVFVTLFAGITLINAQTGVDENVLNKI